ncbi:hypothetical protein FRC06_009639 [Ceratobasidium sp. 370]|nr:hypothetical protein FRC06_009639 [Ceratobasidium sp. 370]
MAIGNDTVEQTHPSTLVVRPGRDHHWHLMLALLLGLASLLVQVLHSSNALQAAAASLTSHASLAASLTHLLGMVTYSERGSAAGGADAGGAVLAGDTPDGIPQREALEVGTSRQVEPAAVDVSLVAVDIRRDLLLGEILGGWGRGFALRCMGAWNPADSLMVIVSADEGSEMGARDGAGSGMGEARDAQGSRLG